MSDAPRLSARAELALFLALAFAPVVLLGAIAAARGGLAAFPAAPIGMLAPALAAIIVQKVQRRPLRAPLGLRLPRWRPLLAGWLGFGALVIAGIALSGAADPALIQTDLDAAASHVALPIADPAQRLSLGLMMTLLIGPWLNIPLFLGEEIGWRGYLAPRLVGAMGARGVIVAGTIWALWHVPLILLGHNYPVAGLAALPVWIGICIALSILLTALRNRGGSVVAPAIAHGAMNQVAGLMMMAFVIEPRWIDWLHAPTGLMMLALAGVPAAAIYRLRPDWLGAPVAEPNPRPAFA